MLKNNSLRNIIYIWAIDYKNTYLMKSKTRYLQYFSLLIFVCALTLNSCKSKNQKQVEINNFAEADKIINSIKPLEFPSNSFNVLDFGAVGDGETNNSEAIKYDSAICSSSHTVSSRF